MPCPLPFSIKTLSRIVYQPRPLSLPSPCSLTSACCHSPLELPSLGTRDHLISTTRSPSSYITLSSIQKTFLRAHHVPGNIQILWPLPPLGCLGAFSSCSTALPGLLALWLCFSIPSAIHQKNTPWVSLFGPFFLPFQWYLLFWFQNSLLQMTPKSLSTVIQCVPKQTHNHPSQVRLMFISSMFPSMASLFSQLSRLETSEIP